MAHSGLRWLGLEVGCLILDKPKFLKQAKALGISVYGLSRAMNELERITPDPLMTRRAFAPA